MDLVNEMLQHFFGDREIGDYAFLQRPDSGDITRGTPEHGFCLCADRGDAFGTSGSTVLANCDDGWFVEDNTLAAHVDQGVCSSQIYREVIGKYTQKASEHGGANSWLTQKT